MVKKIGIVWRNDGDGKGAFWDHYSLQMYFQNCETYIIQWGPIAHSLEDYVTKTFPSQLELTSDHLNKLKVEELVELCAQRNLNTSPKTKDTLIDRLVKGYPQLRHFPKVIDCDNVDVIVIAGVERKSDEDARRAFEEHLVLRYKGTKCIIMLCGGMWRLSAFGFKVESADFHANSKMISLNTSGAVLYNTSIHEVIIQVNETTKAIWPSMNESFTFEVNSVHSEGFLSMSDELLQSLELDIIAYSGSPVLINGVIRQNRAKQDMVSVHCIEALCSKPRETPPLLAIQWHPEAYFDKTLPNPHYDLLNYVVQWPKQDDETTEIFTDEEFKSINIV